MDASNYSLMCLYGATMVISGGFLLLSLILSEIGDMFEGLSEGIDNVFEGVGVDLIPDDISGGDGENSHSIGCTSIAAFFTGFGAAGLWASSSGAGVLLSALAGILFGVVIGGMYVIIMRWMLKQQASTMTRIADLVGVTGMITVSIPKGAPGEVSVTVSGDTQTYSAFDPSDEGIARGTMVKVVATEGLHLFVEAVNKKENTQ